MPLMPPERRRYHRIPCVLPVRLLVRGASYPIETLSKNLSLGGLKCLCPAQQAISTPVNVELALGRDPNALSVPAVVSWFQAIPQSEQFFVGLTFDNLSSENRRILSMYINRSTSKLSAII